MKFLFAILMVSLLTIVITDKVSALRINEIESNPSGDDSGNEWIELYSDSNLDLNGYFLDHEGRGAPINLSGSFSGYFVINLQTQWLRNSNETVYLKLNDQIIHSVGPFTDNKNNDQTYTFCNDEWKLYTSTKNLENLCESPQITNQNSNQEEEPEIEEVEEGKEKNNSNVVVFEELKHDEPKSTKISLVEKQQAQEITKTYKTRIGVIYFFIAFCVFITVLIALKKL